MLKIRDECMQKLRLDDYPPRKIFSAKMKDPMIATMIIIRGLKAVAKTGPLFFITIP